MSWLKKLTSGLSKTSAKVTASLSSLLGRPAIDAASIEEVEDALIAADLGTRVAARLAEGVRRHKFDGEVTAPALAAALADGITEILDPVAMPLDIDPAKRPHVVLLVGLSGDGKGEHTGHGRADHRYRRPAAESQRVDGRACQDCPCDPQARRQRAA